MEARGSVNLDAIDWTAVERLRSGFLGGTSGRADYWRSRADLETYEQTFAQRIGWKWDYVLADLARLGWRPPAGEVLDWGCGTGIAGRKLIERFGLGAAPAGGGREAAITSLALWDRSRMAVDFAQQAAEEAFPDLPVRCTEPSQRQFGTLLVSHVLGELSPQQVDELVAVAAGAKAVVWVEPGTFESSRALIAVRERLRGAFRIVAPCTHQAFCGMLAAGNERHWCHLFAPSPPEVFTDGNWARFARIAGIDLRSLPLSYLVLDKRPVTSLPAGTVRVIGRPRVYKGYGLLMGCDESGVRDRRLMKRTLPEEFRALRRGVTDALQVWETKGDDIVHVSRVNGVADCGL
ncbi:MAG: small ribosomal subunit Rsm22 family protein [Phycisphaerae bacterium]